MTTSVSPDAISTLLFIPKPDSLSDLPGIILQVTHLEPKGKSYGFDANDGKMKINAIFSSRLSSEAISGNIQNLGLIRVLDYTVNEIPSKLEKYLIITKCEVLRRRAVSISREKNLLTGKKKKKTDLTSKV